MVKLKSRAIGLILLVLTLIFFFVCTSHILPLKVMLGDFGGKGSERKDVARFSNQSLVKHEKISQTIISRKRCDQPVFHFVYVKTHKTGSSTLTGVLNQFLMKYNLTKFATHMYPGCFVGGYPGRFKCKFMVPKGSSINIQHIRFDADELKNCFHSNTRYLTIIRKPWDNFLSAYNFFVETKTLWAGCPGLPKYYVKQRKTKDIGQFLLQAAVRLNSSVPYYFRFRNYQSYDLGIDPMLTDVNEIESQIQDLDKNMNLVMLLEYFEESLILLKDLLCFDWDVLSNLGYTNKRHYNHTPLKNTTKKKSFEQLYNIDIALYDHFNKTFWKRVDAYGRDKMARDLEILRSKQTKGKIWPPNCKPQGKIENKLKAELEQYMFENSGKCYFSRENVTFFFT